MKTCSDLYRYMIPKLGTACPRGTALQELWLAAEEFCDRSEAWTQKLEHLDIVAHCPVYSITPTKEVKTWVTGLKYTVGDVVKYVDAFYICAVDHTGAAAFATDLAAKDWWYIPGQDLYVEDWATLVEYDPGDMVRVSNVNYICLVEHTAGTFATDLTAAYWEVLSGFGVDPWITATAYVVGDIVRVTGVDYYCATAHTSGTWATDLLEVKWIVLCAAWVTGTVYAVGTQVAYGSTYYRCVQAHTAATFSTDLGAGRWEQVLQGAQAFGKVKRISKVWIDKAQQAESSYDLVEPYVLRFKDDYVPVDDNNEALDVEVVLVPQPGGNIDAAFLDRWGRRGIMSLAMSTLLSMPDKPWTNGSEAVKFDYQHRRAIVQAKAEKTKQNKGGQRRVALRPFV